MNIMKLANHILLHPLPLKEYGKAIYVLRQVAKIIKKKIDAYKKALEKHMQDNDLKTFEVEGTKAMCTKVAKYKWKLEEVEEFGNENKLDMDKLFIEKIDISVNEEYLKELQDSGKITQKNILSLMDDRSYMTISIKPSKELKQSASE